jgi:flagellin-like protein
VLVVLWFVLVCPGIALVRLLRLEDPFAELTLAVAVSIALALVLSGVGLYAGLWSPTVTLCVLIAITVTASHARLPGARP